MERLYLDFSGSQTGPSDLSCLLKLSTNAMKELYAARETRIGQPSARRHQRPNILKYKSSTMNNDSIQFVNFSFCVSFLKSPLVMLESKEIYLCGTHEIKDNKIDLICIINVKYPNLLILNLGQTGIGSIECISRAYMPQLRQLWIRGNKIVNLKAFRKASLFSLRTLSISGNEVRDCKDISEEHCPKLSQLQIEVFTNQGPEDLSFILKVQAGGIQKLVAIRKGRINQQRVSKSLQNKYLALSIDYFDNLFVGSPSSLWDLSK